MKFSFSETSSHGHPNLVAPTCVSLETNISMHGIRPCSTLTQKLNKYEPLYLFGPSAMRLDATISLRFDIALFQRFRALKILQCLRVFNFSTFQPTPLIYHLSYHLIFIGHRSSLAMPHPIPRSHYPQVFYMVAVAHIAVAKS